MNNSNKTVSAQQHFNTLVPTIDRECARCQMLEVEIERQKQRMNGWNKAIKEVQIEVLEELITKQKTIYGNCAVVTVFDIEKKIEELKNGDKNRA